MPRISVVVPTRDRAAYLALALESALAQTFPDFEILVVDDGSVDRTREVAESFAKVRYLKGEGKGPAHARNLALRNMRGSAAAFLDSDDIWEPRKLERQVRALDAVPAARMAVCNFRLID